MERVRYHGDSASKAIVCATQIALRGGDMSRYELGEQPEVRCDRQFYWAYFRIWVSLTPSDKVLVEIGRPDTGPMVDYRELGLAAFVIGDEP